MLEPALSAGGTRQLNICEFHEPLVNCWYLDMVPRKPTNAAHQGPLILLYIFGCQFTSTSPAQPLSFSKPVSSSVNLDNDTSFPGFLGGLSQKTHVKRVVQWPVQGQVTLNSNPLVYVHDGTRPFP